MSNSEREQRVAEAVEKILSLCEREIPQDLWEDALGTCQLYLWCERHSDGSSVTAGAVLTRLPSAAS